MTNTHHAPLRTRPFGEGQSSYVVVEGTMEATNEELVEMYDLHLERGGEEVPALEKLRPIVQAERARRTENGSH